MKVSVKWNGKKFDDIELELDQPGIVFKTQLYTLTGVEPDRQKILIKGGTLKDDTDWRKIAVKEGQVFMMMGTAGELPKEPAVKPVFLEDMTETQVARALKVPAGLVNLGNTCYLNATLQCLRVIPELQQGMRKGPKSAGAGNPRAAIMTTLSTLYDQLEKSGAAIPPFVFLEILRASYPQFAQQNNQGFMQQDAEECWGEIVSALADNVPSVTEDGQVVPDRKFVDQYLTGEVISTITCDDAPQEPPTVEVSTFRQQKVNIGSGVSTYMVTDLQAGFTEKIEKNSPTLGRSATYTKVSKISRLPAYLTLNFVRFQWKPTERVKAKILKRVKFPFDLDLSGLCTADLQAKLRPAKERIKDVEDRKAEEKKRKAPVDSAAMEVDKPTETKTQAEIAREIGVDETLITDLGANVSGQYELVAVLTHVGRAADSGHYIGWAKNDKGEWWRFDDDTVTHVTQEEITKLEGGGDWHTAYIVLYKAKRLE
ncbi:hypothetical protein DFJ73DRAFT_828813 [Zopfochytrium polystomum]|nr:hypothetical protein DFJ73DRAFT_828813 [Zopfochytrium polystomum]